MKTVKCTHGVPESPSDELLHKVERFSLNFLVHSEKSFFLLTILEAFETFENYGGELRRKLTLAMYILASMLSMLLIEQLLEHANFSLT